MSHCKTIALSTVFSLGLLQSAWAVPSQHSPVPSTAPTAVSEVTVAQAQPQSRRRIAVIDFDFASTGITASALSIFGDVGASKGVSDLLTTRLVQDGTFIMVERSQIETILQEQDLGQSGRIDPGTAAQIGRILGADAVILGSITRFNLEEGRSGTNVLGVSVGNRRGSAEVQLTARLVNTSTAEIIAAAEGAGTGQQGGSSVSVFGLFGNSSDTSGADQILSQATEAAVNQLAEELAAQAPKLAALPPVLPNVSALVADVSGGLVTINRGTQDGFRSGMILSIERVTREVKDPTTGEVIRTLTAPVGRVQLTDVDARSGVGTIMQGTGFQIGDQAVAVE